MNRTNQIAPVSTTPSRAPERARGGTSVNQRGARDAVLSSSEQSFDAIDNAALETPSDEQSFGTRENINVDDDDDVDDARSTPETVEETRSNGASFPASDATSARRRKAPSRAMTTVRFRWKKIRIRERTTRTRRRSERARR